MARYSVELTDGIFAMDFFSFAKNIGRKISKK